MSKVFALNKPEFVYIIFGCLACVVSGGVQPAFAIVFSKATAVNILIKSSYIFSLLNFSF
jgi:hypothetical protein